MTEDECPTRECHERIARMAFNRTWDLLDNVQRTDEEALEMVHTAHASRYHWGKIGTPLEFERGEWQISRVYSVLGKPMQALYHAENCLRICEANGIKDFDIGFAYEAMARAQNTAGNSEERDKYIKLAMIASRDIEDQGNVDYLLSELKTIE